MNGVHDRGGMQGVVRFAAREFWGAAARLTKTVVALVGLLLFSAVGVSAEVVRWHIDGATREAIVHAPAASREGKRPVVLSFHGRGDSMRNFEHTGIHALWPDAIVVYFQGLETASGLSGWQVEKGESADRDLKLVDAALASLRQRFDVDDRRIYATGFSNGGMFTYLLWAERPDVFAAYAPVAGRLRPAVRPTRPKPVFHVAGERDRQVNFSDQKAAIAVAVEVNGASSTTTTACGGGCTLHGAGTGAPVMTWIHPGGHVYPAGTSERIVSFFRDHPNTQ